MGQVLLAARMHEYNQCPNADGNVCSLDLGGARRKDSAKRHLSTTKKCRFITEGCLCSACNSELLRFSPMVEGATCICSTAVFPWPSDGIASRHGSAPSKSGTTLPCSVLGDPRRIDHLRQSPRLMFRRGILQLFARAARLMAVNDLKESFGTRNFSRRR